MVCQLSYHTKSREEFEEQFYVLCYVIQRSQVQVFTAL